LCEEVEVRDTRGVHQKCSEGGGNVCVEYVIMMGADVARRRGGSEGTYGAHSSPPYPIHPLTPTHAACKAHTYAPTGASSTKPNNRSRARPDTPGALPQTSHTAHHPCGQCVFFETAPQSVHARTPSITAHKVASKASGTGSERCQGAECVISWNSAPQFGACRQAHQDPRAG
jgi:hypothetical protein